MTKKYRQPDIYTASRKSLDNILCMTCEKENGDWEPVRPYPHNAWSFKYRWKLAYNVLIGKYDVLKWIPNKSI